MLEFVFLQVDTGSNVYASWDIGSYFVVELAQHQNFENVKNLDLNIAMMIGAGMHMPILLQKEKEHLFLFYLFLS